VSALPSRQPSQPLFSAQIYEPKFFIREKETQINQPRGVFLLANDEWTRRERAGWSVGRGARGQEGPAVR
jgi:hypothetical protein